MTSSPPFNIKTEPLEEENSSSQCTITVMSNESPPEPTAVLERPYQSHQANSMLSKRPPVTNTPGSYEKCTVPTCNNYFDPRPEFVGVSYIGFPEDPGQKKIWLNEVGAPETSGHTNPKICSDHFVRFRICNPEEIISKSTVKCYTNPGRVFRDNDIEQESERGNCSQFIATEETPIDDYNNSLPVNLTDEVSFPVIASVSAINNGGLFEENISSGVDVPVRMLDPLLSSSEAVPSTSVIESTNEDPSEDQYTPSENPEKGLIIIPASVKPPPLISNTLHTFNYAIGASKVIPLVGDVLNNESALDEPHSDKALLSHTSDGNISVNDGIKTRKRRSTRAEMLRREEEEEWEPSFWCKRKWRENSNNDAKKKKSIIDNKLTVGTVIDDSKSVSATELANCYMDEDEGWRIAEPVITMEDDTNNVSANPTKTLSQSDNQDCFQTAIPILSIKKRRPGPASKTCRPQYVPEQKDECFKNVSSPLHTVSDEPKREAVMNNSSTVSDTRKDEKGSKSSFLVEWCFFKSLIPDLKKMDNIKRVEFKNFILDTLNDAVYGGKSIQ